MSRSLQDDHSQEVRTVVHELRHYLDPAKVRTILDVGSRDAKESINLKTYFCHATAYTFECNPPAIELCKKNIGDRKDIILITKAISDREGQIDFYAIDPEKTITTHADGNIGASSLLKANAAYPYEKYHQKKIIVDTVTLESWAKETHINEIDLIWIDLQGAEIRAFKGMGELIKQVKIIYTEVEFKEMYVGQPLFQDVDEYLCKRGFHLLKLYHSDWLGNAIYIQEDFIINPIKIIILIFREKMTRGFFLLRQFKANIVKFVKKQ